MLSKLQAILAALAVAVLFGFGLKWHFDSVSHLKVDLASAQAQVQATNKALKAKDTAIATINKKYNQQSKELADALQESSEWASTPVPDSVFNSLFHDH